MEILVGVLILAVLVCWAVLSGRIRELESRIEAESRERCDLLARVEKLGKITEPEPVTMVRAPEPVKIPVPEPAPRPIAPQAPRRVCQFCGRAVENDVAICFCGAVIDPKRVPPPLPRQPSIPEVVAEPAPVDRPVWGAPVLPPEPA